MPLASQLVYHASYTIPEGVEVSSSCQDLLARIFVPDPCQRIALDGIQRHPWFRKNLPRGAEPEVADWGRRLPRWLCCFQVRAAGSAGGLKNASNPKEQCSQGRAGLQGKAAGKAPTARHSATQLL